MSIIPRIPLVVPVTHMYIREYAILHVEGWLKLINQFSGMKIAINICGSSSNYAIHLTLMVFQ
ncbi:hypothetical protein EPI10_022015 [Gossypium australe]|uniref:Uncharacterized protein n=1 Tax=Gossypium australe TaxID=47621 RepID=A0A5B6WIQ4_9ROSI|nr:hypothetical protein EPI10_022015 [Gossypium australe]